MGGLLTFRVGNFDTTAEREQFRFLCEQLKTHYEDSNEFCVFAGNYNIGCELDALFIKKDAIISIEFKNYGGNVVANENGEWTCNGKIIKGGSRKTVLQQARINHSTVKKELKVLGVVKNQIKDVPHLIIFHQPIELENNLSATNRSWLHITDSEHFIEKLDDITCPHTDLAPLGIVKLAETLNLNPFYLTEFSNATYDKPAEPIEKIELIEDIKKYEPHTEEKKQKKKEVMLNFDSFVVEDENSIALSNFVKRIVKLSLKLDNFTVKVLDSTRASSSFAAHGIRLTQEYVVTINADGIGEHCAKLAKFINHAVKAISPSTIFWEEGERIATESDNSSGVVEEHQSKELSNTNSNVCFRKSKTILPHWLDKKIFNDHQAIYAPEHERYEYNLDLNEEELKVYLGTYFPRSYAEMFCIADNLLQNKCLKKTLEQDEISVLDYGCGTGGEILGLITAIGRHLPHTKISITAIDGNDGALAILKDLVECNPNKNIQVELTTFSQTLGSIEDVEKLAFGKNDYHFILCDKMVCELISKEVLPINAYAIMAKKLTAFLHENGLLIMLDVTTKDEHSGYFYPQLPVYAHNKAWQRIEDSLVELTTERMNVILDEPIFGETDWSAQIVPDATIDDLDEVAIAKARKMFKKVHSRIPESEVNAWDIQTFLGKCGLTRNGSITRAAIILLGKYESAFKLRPVVAQVTWTRRDANQDVVDYEHFTVPFILTVDEILSKIENLTLREMPGGTLFPDTMKQYDDYTIREALHNCIAHQDYTMQQRVNFVENPGYLYYSNAGTFIPGTLENALRNEESQTYFRNECLCKAMVDFNMIDTVSRGIKKMFNEQWRRHFPMPDYEIDAAKKKVVVRIYGNEINKRYTDLLKTDNTLSLWDCISLDAVQKGRFIHEDVAKDLLNRGLIEGDAPNYTISLGVAKATRQLQGYTKQKGLDKDKIKQMVLQYLKNAGSDGAKRDGIYEYIKDVMPQAKTREQQLRILGDILNALSVDKLIFANGRTWFLKE